MIMDDNIETPTTIKEVGIHVAYMRRDICEVKDIIKSLPTAFVPIKEHQELTHRVENIESYNDKIKNRIVAFTVIGIVLMVLAQYGLDKYFS